MSNKLTIFYDGNCPMCNLEMQKLKMHDKQNLITLENLHQANFNDKYPNIDSAKAMKILHGEYQNKILLGLDVTHRAWTLVGKGFFVAPLQFPIVKQLSHGVYLLLAKYRHPISNFLYQRLGIGNKKCIQGVCYDQSNNNHHRSK